jgi:signal recognition particle GTPase
MFDALGEKLSAVFQRLGGKGRLTEKDIDEALKEVRVALLEADVNFRVAREFVAKVKERCLDADLLQGLNPGQQVVKVVDEELTAILSAGDHRLHHGNNATAVLMLIGLQGSGKTTTAAKLAVNLAAGGRAKPMLVAADLRRPAAVDQLMSLGKQLDMPVYSEPPASSTAVRAAKNGAASACSAAVGDGPAAKGACSAVASVPGTVVAARASTRHAPPNRRIAWTSRRTLKLCRMVRIIMAPMSTCASAMCDRSSRAGREPWG